MYLTDKRKEYIFHSVLKNVLREFMAEKRMAGYIYSTEGIYLCRIDKLAVDFSLQKVELTRDFVERYSKKSEFESAKTWQNRLTIINEFGSYLLRQGYLSYIPERHNIKEASTFTPYIYSYDELRRFFKVADDCVPRPWCPNRHNIIGILFRLIYGCGLRLSEALHLKVEHVDLENGVLIIFETKFNKNRYVPMSKDLQERVNLYFSIVHNKRKYIYFFPSPDGGCYSRRAINTSFRLLLFQAGIPYNGSTPRIHDLRHSFAVHCLKNWVNNGQNISALLPILSAYMGHENLKGTQRYLRLTADVFPSITNLMENYYKRGISDESKL